jgi:uncharacterized protein
MEERSVAQDLVSDLRSANPDIDAAVVATADGFVLAEDTIPDMSPDMLAALGTDLLGRASRSAEEFGRGQIDELYFRGPEGYMTVVRAGAGQALVCVANANVTLGLLLADVRRAAAKLA